MNTLVIGFGNPLRGDDALGVLAAEAIQSWILPSVHVLTCQQLAPELMDDMKQARRILFIDAAMDAGGEAFQTQLVAPRKSRQPLGHHESPANLLALLRELEGPAPPAWLVTITAVSLEHGGTLTQDAERNLNAALLWMRAWLEQSGSDSLVY